MTGQIINNLIMVCDRTWPNTAVVTPKMKSFATLGEQSDWIIA